VADDDPDAVDELGAKPFQRWDQIPAVMRGVLLNIRWDRDALFRLSLPVEEVPVGELRWQLELPWWRDGDRHFAIAPTDVRADPVRYHAHWKRTLDADLRYPIHLLATTPRLRILDGVHRLLKAEISGERLIRACRVDRESLKRIVLPKRRT
jgi:hypothetical protein